MKLKKILPLTAILLLGFDYNPPTVDMSKIGSLVLTEYGFELGVDLDGDREVDIRAAYRVDMVYPNGQIDFTYLNHIYVE